MADVEKIATEFMEENKGLMQNLAVLEAYEKYEVNDADFDEACKRASYWAKKRIMKKMTKRPFPKDVEEAVKRFVWLNRGKE